MFREGQKIMAYSWNGVRDWDLVGEVQGSSKKKTPYPGDQLFPAGEYDYVFDVELGENGRTARLPYNDGRRGSLKHWDDSKMVCTGIMV